MQSLITAHCRDDSRMIEKIIKINPKDTAMNIDMSKAIANNQQYIKELDQTDKEFDDLSQSKPPIFLYRPNNTILAVKILNKPLDFHLPVIKRTGKNTIKEFLYWTNATFEICNDTLRIYPHKRFTRVIKNKADVDKSNEEYRDLIIGLMRTFTATYPSVSLDELNAQVKTREFEIKDKALKNISRKMRLKDDIFKKVYQTGVEFYDPTYVKNYITNRALEDKKPDFDKRIDILTNQLAAFGSQLEIHLAAVNQLVANTKPKESIFMRVWKKIKEISK
jgi:hypothetical protein